MKKKALFRDFTLDFFCIFIYNYTQVDYEVVIHIRISLYERPICIGFFYLT